MFTRSADPRFILLVAAGFVMLALPGMAQAQMGGLGAKALKISHPYAEAAGTHKRNALRSARAPTVTFVTTPSVWLRYPP
jgi:hypothetical protein